MIDLAEIVKNTVCKTTFNRIAVGVSGGRDSVCLLHALAHCGLDRSRIIAVHVNHCLRTAADSDERFVRVFCERLGVRCSVFRVDVKREAAVGGLTIEQAARSLRYGVFFDLIKSGEADCILTAHHALDNAESVLMHMFRGAGLDGLCGMAEYDNSRKILRPLLSVYPSDLDEYVKKNRLDFVTDETNLCDDADRNFIRLNVLPLVQQRYAGAVRAVNELSRECASSCAELEKSLDDGQIKYDRGAWVISFSALNGGLAARYVRRALARGFSLTDVTRDQVQNVVELADKRVGAIAELASGVKAEREAGGVALYIPRIPFAGEVKLRLGRNFIDGLAVDVNYTDADPRDACGVVDCDKLDGAVLRFRRDGDVFTPFGGGSKKLKQYFTDNKSPNRIKDRTPLVCIGNEVLVVVGMQVSDKVKVTDATVRKAMVAKLF